MDGKILITGATGNVGSEVLNALVERGQKVKAAVHTMEKVQNMEWDIGNVEIVPFDYRQPTTWENVFQNVDKMLLVAPPGEALSFQLVNPLINSAKDHGVEKIVMISALGTDKDEDHPLRIVEDHLIASGIGYVILRCNWFMQNFLTIFKDGIRKAGRIQVPAENGRISFIDTRDIAAFAVEVFEDPQYINQKFQLTGKDAIGFYSVAKIFSEKLERIIKYVPLSEDDARKDLLATGMPEANVNMFLNLYLDVREAGAEIITHDIKKVLKRDPITFEQFVEDYLAVWSDLEQFIT